MASKNEFRQCPQVCISKWVGRWAGFTFSQSRSSGSSVDEIDLKAVLTNAHVSRTIRRIYDRIISNHQRKVLDKLAVYELVTIVNWSKAAVEN